MTFRKILDHQGPLKPSSPNYKGSAYNVKVLWEDNTEAWEPLNILGKDDPVTFARYAHEQNLLDTPGWKFLRRIGCRIKFLKRMIAASKHHQKQHSICYKFGLHIPHDYKDALLIDKSNDNTHWQNAIQLELDNIDAHCTFRDLGPGTPLPSGYHNIRVHFVFDVKEDGHCKAQLVAGGHLTPIPYESVYSSVAALCSLRIAILIGELNGLSLMSGDIGYAYLNSYTKEKVGFVARPEF